VKKKFYIKWRLNGIKSILKIQKIYGEKCFTFDSKNMLLVAL
jgi:hypothetical protein